MKIAHIAVWVTDLDRMKDFYCLYFAGKCNQKYFNPTKNFQSYFIDFENGAGARLELMHSPTHNLQRHNSDLGWAHIAFSVGSREKVDLLTNKLRIDGFVIVGEPRMTGDGYYESVLLDPENNIIEITA